MFFSYAGKGIKHLPEKQDFILSVPRLIAYLNARNSPRA